MADTRPNRHLTRKQEAFINEYLKDDNIPVYQCVLNAGYNTQHPHTMGNELLNNSLVKKAIEVKREELERDLRIDRKYILKGLQDIAKQGRKLIPVMDKEGNVIGSKQVDATAAARALELLGKSKAMWIDKQQLDASLTVKTLESFMLSTSQDNVSLSSPMNNYALEAPDIEEEPEEDAEE